MQQQTIARSFSLRGVGLHLGRETTVEFRPAPGNSGIVFARKDLPGEPRVQAVFRNRRDQGMRCTSLQDGPAEVHTVEHILAACSGLQIDNALVCIDGPEVPGMDGSALPFCEAILDAGLVELSEPARKFAVERSVQVEEKGSAASASPFREFRLEYFLDYNLPFLLAQSFGTTVAPEIFVREVAPARTFVLRREAEYLKKMGMGKGASTRNTLVIGEDGRVIENELRFPDEFARHKTLDLLGDLALFGCRLQGRFSGLRSGHSLNARLVSELIASDRSRELQGQ